MSKQEAPLHALAQYLPQGALEPILAYLHQYKIHLTITRARATVLGDYRNAVHGKNHRISVNGNLNPYAFLITLLHEMAHLLTYEKYGHAVAPHGKEWKQAYGALLAGFLDKKIFPADIARALQRSLHSPSATTCGEEHLMRVLKQYDKPKQGWAMVEALAQGQLFKTSDGRIFRKGPKLRKRIQCTEVKTGQVYLFSAVYEVEIVGHNATS